MNDNHAQQVVNALRQIVIELQNLNRNVQDVSSQIRRK